MFNGTLRFFHAHPLETIFALIVSSTTFSILFFVASVSFPVALPWALFAAAALRLTIKKETTLEKAQRLIRRQGL